MRSFITEGCEQVALDLCELSRAVHVSVCFCVMVGVRALIRLNYKCYQCQAEIAVSITYHIL